MKKYLALLTAILSLGWAPGADAWTVTPDHPWQAGSTVAGGYVDTNGKIMPVTTASPLPAADGNNAAFQGVVAMTNNTAAYAAARSIGFNCTVGGNVIVTFPDASTLQVPVTTGWQTFPFAATEWTTTGVSGVAATCTAVNLK